MAQAVEFGSRFPRLRTTKTQPFRSAPCRFEIEHFARRLMRARSEQMCQPFLGGGRGFSSATGTSPHLRPLSRKARKGRAGTPALQRGLSSPGAFALSDRSLSATPEIAAQNVEAGQPSLPLRASLPTSFPTAFFYLLDSSGHSRFVLRILIIRVSSVFLWSIGLQTSEAR